MEVEDFPSLANDQPTLPEIRLETPPEGRNNWLMSRTYRISRRTYQRVTDSRTPRTPGYRAYQMHKRGAVTFD